MDKVSVGDEQVLWSQDILLPSIRWKAKGGMALVAVEQLDKMQSTVLHGKSRPYLYTAYIARQSSK